MSWWFAFGVWLFVVIGFRWFDLDLFGVCALLVLVLVCYACVGV